MSLDLAREMGDVSPSYWEFAGTWRVVRRWTTRTAAQAIPLYPSSIPPTNRLVSLRIRPRKDCKRRRRGCCRGDPSTRLYHQGGSSHLASWPRRRTSTSRWLQGVRQVLPRSCSSNGWWENLPEARDRNHCSLQLGRQIRALSPCPRKESASAQYVRGWSRRTVARPASEPTSQTEAPSAQDLLKLLHDRWPEEPRLRKGLIIRWH